MNDPVVDSSSPLFVSFGSDPNFVDPLTCAMTREKMLEHLADSHAFGRGYENGEIVCELVPIDYLHHDENGKATLGGVKEQSLVDMLELQARNVKGDDTGYDEESDPVPEKSKELPEYLSLGRVGEILEEKGYATVGTKRWDPDAIAYWVLDPTGNLKGSVAGPCGRYYPIKPVNNPIWGQEEAYEPMFLTAQIMSIPPMLDDEEGE